MKQNNLCIFRYWVIHRFATYWISRQVAYLIFSTDRLLWTILNKPGLNPGMENNMQTVILAPPSEQNIVRCSASIWTGVTDSYSDRSSQRPTSISISKNIRVRKRELKLWLTVHLVIITFVRDICRIPEQYRIQDAPVFLHSWKYFAIFCLLFSTFCRNVLMPASLQQKQSAVFHYRTYVG